VGEIVGGLEEEETVADVVDAEEVEVEVELLLVLVGDELLVLGTDVMNNERSFCWKATVIGCAHMVIWPDTTVDGPSESSAATTVVTPDFVNMLVHP